MLRKLYVSDAKPEKLKIKKVSAELRAWIIEVNL